MVSYGKQRQAYPFNLHSDGVGTRSGATVEALRYKPEGRGFDSRW
jgi:hypothetical protein